MKFIQFSQNNVNKIYLISKGHKIHMHAIIVFDEYKLYRKTKL